MAEMTTVHPDDLTAASLLWMGTTRAKIIACGFVAATVASLWDFGGDNREWPHLLLAVAVVGVGIAVLMTTTRTDPMPLPYAIAAATCVPTGALITALAAHGPLSTPNQANALGAGVALNAFLCVRGRVGTAWCAQLTAFFIFSAWGPLTGQDPWAGVRVAVPNLAVLAMATVFARLMRPAAADVRRLHAEAIERTGEISESQAREAEGIRQNDKLRVRAWPAIALLASESELTKQQLEEIRLDGDALRDSVRAPILDTPEVARAVRHARRNGVTVTMLDDGGLDQASGPMVSAFLAAAVEWLQNATDDSRVTVRVWPPGRPSLASIVAVSADGVGHGCDMSADGRFDFI